VEHHPAAVDQGDRLAEVLHQIELVTGEEEDPARSHMVEDHGGQEVDRHRVEA
jgi:hypothetical protein